ncbi:MAG: hypothetical protein ACRDEB_02840, partial [Chitinophagaceae bacterium]
MSGTRGIIICITAFFLLAGCKNKKRPSLSGDEPVEVSDFIEFFQPLKLSYQINDSLLSRKEKDSLLISYNNFTLFVPDSLLKKVFGKGVKPKIYAIGKCEVPKAEKYIFVKAVASEKKAILLLAFDRKDHFIAGMTALSPDAKASTMQSVI